MVRERNIIKKFETLTKEAEPKPNIFKNCVRAFLVGGIICDLGQIIMYLLTKYGIPKDDIGPITSIIMIFLGALLTGIGIYDNIATYAGAGTVVPITGFANSMVSPAIEFKKEGFIFGVASKMFTIAGPVLVYGIGSSVLVGIIYYIIELF